MTDAELEVERDWLLEHGRTVEEVERMQRAWAMEVELLTVLANADGCLLPVCGGPECCRDGRIRALLGISKDGFSPVLSRLVAISTTESPDGASAPRPEGETR